MKSASSKSYQLNFSGNEVIFGSVNEDDIILIRTAKSTRKSSSLYYSGKQLDFSEEKCISLSKNVLSLCNASAFALFNLTLDNLKRIKFLVDKVDGTHLRFHNYKNKLRISIFDYRSFNESSRIGRKESKKILYVEIDARNTDDFTFTVKAKSIKKLPTQDYLVRIGTNDICEFTSVTDNAMYLLRNQLISEPVTVFPSKLVGSDIAFVFHPNSLNEVVNTNQSLDLESV
jgi:hypothetical protein